MKNKGLVTGLLCLGSLFSISAEVRGQTSLRELKAWCETVSFEGEAIEELKDKHYQEILREHNETDHSETRRIADRVLSNRLSICVSRGYSQGVEAVSFFLTRERRLRDEKIAESQQKLNRVRGDLSQYRGRDLERAKRYIDIHMPREIQEAEDQYCSEVERMQKLNGVKVRSHCNRP